MGLNVAGVDMLRSAHGPVVMEVNSSPGLEGIEKTTNINVAREIIAFLEKNAKPEPHAHTGQGMTPFQIGRHGVAPGRRETVDLPVSALLQAHAGDAAGACAAWREAGARLLPFRRHAWRRDPGRRDHPAHPGSSGAAGHGRDLAGGAHRQQLRLSQSHPLHAGPARSQPLLSGFRPRFAGQPRGRSLLPRGGAAAATTASICTRRPCTAPTCRRSGLRPASRSFWIWRKAFAPPVILVSKLREKSLRLSARRSRREGAAL